MPPRCKPSDGVRFKDMWGCPMLDFAGIALFALTAAPPITQSGIRRFAIGWIVVFGLAIGALTVVNTAQPYLLGRGTREQFPSQAAATAIAKAWATQTHGRPLKIVIGNNWLAGLLSAYHPDRPSIVIDGQMWKSPWISREQLSRDGAVLIWQSPAKSGRTFCPNSPARWSNRNCNSPMSPTPAFRPRASAGLFFCPNSRPFEPEQSFLKAGKWPERHVAVESL